MTQPDDAAPVRAGAALPRWAVAGLTAALALGLGFGVAKWSAPAPPPGPSQRPTPSLIVAIRDMSRLETTELHVEKVIDLTDKQSHFWGLIDANDAMLLVASGDVTIGVDLGKLRDGDVTLDPATGAATITLPEPEILSTRLDEKGTYVYERKTDLLARRDEHLETKARQAAVDAIEKAARDADLTGRSKAQAARQLEALARSLGAKTVDIHWR